MKIQNNLNYSNNLVADINSLNRLKSQNENPEALKEVVKQLESLFMHELIKSMRSSIMQSGLFNENKSNNSNFAQDMLDQQYSLSLSGLSENSLSKAIERQFLNLSNSDNYDNKNDLNNLKSLNNINQINTLDLIKNSKIKNNNLNLINKVKKEKNELINSAKTIELNYQQNLLKLDNNKSHLDKKEKFIFAHIKDAQKVSKESGIPAIFILGQAAHETGWGQSEILNRNGKKSFNLFGIKADKNWQGKVAEITTSEYINGKEVKTKAKFRAYSSYEESLRDYANLIINSKRYQSAKNQTHSALAYSNALQKAGYATDPKYAKKLSNIINNIQKIAYNQRHNIFI